MVIFRLAGVASLAMAVMASPVRAESAETEAAPLTLVQPEGLPFSGAEIRRALLARLPPPGGDLGEAGFPSVQVEPAGAGAVIVDVGPRSRLVTVGKRSGVDAARVVALVIADLVSEDTEGTGTADAPAAPSVSVAGAPIAPRPTVADDVVIAAPRAPTAQAHRLCLTAGAAKGTGDDEPVARTMDVDLVMPLGDGRLRFAPSVGLILMPTRNAGNVNEASFTAGVVRALAGASFGPVDLLAGPVASPYAIGGAMPYNGVLFAGEALARLTVPLWDRLRLVGAARLDAFVDRTRVHLAGGDTYATPRLQIGVAVGVAWDWQS
jgi:hypothetical protein